MKKILQQIQKILEILEKNKNMWRIITGFIFIIVPFYLSYPYLTAGDTVGAVSRITSPVSIILFVVGIIFIVWGIKKLMNE